MPPGWNAVTPRIVARYAEGLVEFLWEVFGAQGDFEEERPSVIMIGDSAVMITEAGIRNPFPAFLYVYVNDLDTIYGRAVAAGVVTHEEPLDTPYGDRRCMVEDKWGNMWQIATYMG